MCAVFPWVFIQPLLNGHCVYIARHEEQKTNGRTTPTALQVFTDTQESHLIRLCAKRGLSEEPSRSERGGQVPFREERARGKTAQLRRRRALEVGDGDATATRAKVQRREGM